jgi:hypothetical protein
MTVDALRPFVARKRPGARAGLACEICAVPIGEHHAHVFERGTRGILCSCPACAALFKNGALGGRLRTIGDRVLFDPNGRIEDVAWAALSVPVQLAFLTFDSGESRWAVTYPSPAGPVRAEVPREASEAFAARVPIARHVRPDIEALVVRASQDGERECYVAPIDACYSLVGAVRTHWTGMLGGDGVRVAVSEFFDRLRARAEAVDASAPGTR